MGNDFSFVKEGLSNVRKGDPNRAEIHAIIEDFKESVRQACKTLFDKEVFFEPVYPPALGRHFMSRFLMHEGNTGTVAVYLASFSCLRLFQYELDPILGYPVVLSYSSKTVRCEGSTELLEAIKDAYNLSVGDLKDFCESGGTRMRWLSGCAPLSSVAWSVKK